MGLVSANAYDAREGSFRDRAPTDPMQMSGVMQYVKVDVGNLKKWLAGTTGTTGSLALNSNGYILFFSDRRGNHTATAGNPETGEFGFEDQVNSTSSAGTPDSTLQSGEDVNGDGVQQLYGGTPSTVAGVVIAGATAPYDGTAAGSGPQATIVATDSGTPRVNKVVLFRRALMMDNGGLVSGVNNLPASGLTVVSENPAYVQGDYNATGSNTLAEPNAPASVIGDAITLLSNAWTDVNSFEQPNQATARSATTTGWRFAALAQAKASRSYCAAACGSPGQLFGTDGGAANFLRLLENWNISGVSLNYRGSIVSLHINRQAIGTYKFDATGVKLQTYEGGVRSFNFDTDFLTPSLLPPGTPAFRDTNTLKFTEILRPNQ